MSILGYSSAYFLPQYWVNTPLYGEKIIPLLDYVLSTDYQHTDKLASAFYDIESKYKNTADLPIDKIEAIIEESGYGYIRELLGQDEDSLRLLVYILVLVHELKGSRKGIKTVLELLKTQEDALELRILGNPSVSNTREVSGITETDYVSYANFTVNNDPFELTFKIHTSNSFIGEQCIASSSNYGFYLGIDEEGHLVLKVGVPSGDTRVWQSFNGKTTNKSSRTLEVDTDYIIRLEFSGYDYTLVVTKDGVSSNYLSIDSSAGLGIINGIIFIGVDASTNTVKNPFKGTISLAPFSLIASNVQVTQWFETFPVEPEDTFTVDADLDVNLISADFFVKFAKFVERYVYPTLRVFRVKMGLKSKVTFLPYVRQKVTYIASNIKNAGYESFLVLRENSRADHQMYGVRVPSLYAWEYTGYVVYTKTADIFAATKLYNRDMTPYTGTDFRVEEKVGNGFTYYEVTYLGNSTERAVDRDIYGTTPYQTIVEDD